MSIERDIKKQAELQRKDIRETGASFREEARQEAEELRTGIRKGISQTEREAQESIKQIRTLKSEAQRLRDIGTRVDVEPHKKAIKEVQKQSQDIISKAVKSGRELTEAEKELIKEIDSNVAEALKEVDKKERGTIKELREKYVELKDGELVDRKEFMKLPAAAQLKLKELGTKGYGEYVETEKAKAQKDQQEFKEQNIELSTGEWIDRNYYESLNTEQQKDLKQLGVEKFNEKMRADARAQFHADNVALGNGEWVSREFFETLDTQQQQDLARLGTTEFVASENKKAQEFKRTHFQLPNGDWVNIDYYNSLPVDQQQNLFTMGVDKFNKYQAEQVEAFKQDNIQLPNGEWVNKEFYSTLDPAQQKELSAWGTEGFNTYYDAKEAAFKQDNIQLETGEWVGRDFYESLKGVEGAQEILTVMGVDAYNNWASAMAEYETTETSVLPAQLSSKEEDLDLVSTLPEEYKSGEGYDLARYIRDNRDDPNTIKQLSTVYGFSNESIKEAIQYANQDYYRSGNVENFVKELEQQGITDLNKEQIQMAAEYITTGDIKIDQSGSIASGALNAKQAVEVKKMFAKVDTSSLKTVASAAITDGDKQANMSVNEFVANYLASRNIDEKEIDKYKAVAELEYNNLYGEKQYIESKFINVAELIAPVFKALQPGKTKKDITGADWAISAAQLAMIVVAPALGAVGKAATTAGNVARLSSKAVQVAAAGAFNAATIMDWDKMSTTEKVINSVINLAILGAALKPANLAHKLTSSAYKAEKEWKALQTATKELKATSINSKTYASMAAKAQKAAQASRKADLAFIEKLERTLNLSKSQLAQLEKISGFKGLKTAITDISKAKNGVKKVWDKLDDVKLGSKEYIETLPKLAESQNTLQKSLANYNTILKPRVKNYGNAMKNAIDEVDDRIVKLKQYLSKAQAESKKAVTVSGKERNYQEIFELEDDIKRLTMQKEALQTAYESGVLTPDIKTSVSVKTKTKFEPRFNIEAATGKTDDMFSDIRDLFERPKGEPLRMTRQEPLKAITPSGGIAEVKPQPAKPKPRVMVKERIATEPVIITTKELVITESLPALQEAAATIIKNAPNVIDDIVKPIAGLKATTGVTVDTGILTAPQTTIKGAAKGITDNIIKTSGVTLNRAEVIDAVEGVLAKAVNSANDQLYAEATEAVSSTKAVSATDTRSTTDAIAKSIVDTDTVTDIEKVIEEAIESETKTITDTQVKTAVQEQVKTLTAAALLTVFPATSTIGKTPIPIRIPLPDDEFKELTKKESEGAVGWKQGFIYILIYPPYGDNQTVYTKEPIPGVPYHDGLESAYKSITKIGGKLPPKILKDMGIMDVKITTVKGKPKISFKRDEKVIRGLSSAR